MILEHLRMLLRNRAIELDLSLPHAITEARKDGLTTEDLEAAVFFGEVVEDYGERVLLLHQLAAYRIPFHVVLEFVPGEQFATVVTAYIPDRALWEPDWKTRKKGKGQRGQRKRK